MIGYLFGLLITGLIIMGIVLECYKSKDQLKGDLNRSLTALKSELERNRKKFKYQKEAVLTDIKKIKKKSAKV